MTDTPTLPRYRSHKIVEAAPIYTDGGQAIGEPHVVVDLPDGKPVAVHVPASFFARGKPERGDYLVRYEDGYLSWSPKKAFEEGYTLISDDPPPLSPTPDDLKGMDTE